MPSQRGKTFPNFDQSDKNVCYNPFSDQKYQSKPIPSRVTHTFIIHIRDLTPTPRGVLFTCNALKGPSQPPPFSMPSKLFALHGEAKSSCFSVSWVPEGMFDYAV